MRSLILTALLLLPSLLFGQGIDVPASVAAGEHIIARVSKVEAKGYIWLIIDPTGQMLVDPRIVFKDSRIPDTVVVGGGNGKYQFMLIASHEGGALEQFTATSVRGGVIPPGPKPDPGPGPITPGPVSMLLIRETADDTHLTDDQEMILFGPNVVPLLRQKAAKDAKNVPKYRFWDDDYTDEQLASSPEFKDAYIAARAKWQKDGLPYFVLWNQASKVEGKLPSEKELLELINKYSGN